MAIDVWMTHPDRGAIASPPLPGGYRMRLYGKGDLATWLRTQAHGPFFVPTAETFAASMPGDTAGAEVGTVTAWSNVSLTGREIGRIPAPNL